MQNINSTTSRPMRRDSNAFKLYLQIRRCGALVTSLHVCAWHFSNELRALLPTKLSWVPDKAMLHYCTYPEQVLTHSRTGHVTSKKISTAHSRKTTSALVWHEISLVLNLLKVSSGDLATAQHYGLTIIMVNI